MPARPSREQGTGDRKRRAARRAGCRRSAALAALTLAACVSSRPIEAPATAANVEEGLASWYGEPYHGRATASGTRYDMHEMTAAHRTLPFGTRLRVRNLANGREASVIINDRGPFVAGRIIDLSHAAAVALDAVGPGVIPVRATVETLGDGMLDAPCWEVQVGAFALADNAVRAGERLSSLGMKVRTAPAGGGLMRVRATGLGDRSAAASALSRTRPLFPDAVAVPCGGER